MKATGFFSVATLATAATAAPIVDGLIDTVEGVVAGLPIVGDLLEQVPVGDLLDGVFARLPVDDLVDRLPIHDIVSKLPVHDIVNQLPVAEIVETVNNVGHAVDGVVPVKRDLPIVDSLPLIGGLIDSLNVDDILSGVLGVLPVDGLLERLPAQDIINRLPVQDVIARLPLSEVLENVPVAGGVVKRSAAPRDVPVVGELPIVGILLDNLPVSELLDGVVGLLSVDDIVSILPVQDIVARLPVADLTKALPVKRDALEKLDIVALLEKLISGVQGHTKAINATLTKVENGQVEKKQAEASVIDQIDGVQLDLTEIISSLTNDAGIPVAPAQIDRVLALVNVLVAELLATVNSLVTILGLRPQLITLLHSVFRLLANVLTLLTGLLAGLLPGLVASLSPLLAGLGNGLLAPLLTPIVALVAGLAGPLKA